MDSFRAVVGLCIHLSRDKFMVSFRAAAEVDLHQTRVLTLIKLFYGMMVNHLLLLLLLILAYVLGV